MYVINARHYLNDKGAIAPEKGAAKKMAEFVMAVVAHASDFDRAEEVQGPLCHRCKKSADQHVKTAMDDDEIIHWFCSGCSSEWRISDWQGTFWDLSKDAATDRTVDPARP